MNSDGRINSKKKGSRVELELVNWLKERGIASARRTQQFSGTEGTSDVVAPLELPSFHIEVKGTAGARLERSKIRAWVEQIYRDKVSDSLPIIFHKANNKPWVAMFRAEEFQFLFDYSEAVPVAVGESFEAYGEIEKLMVRYAVNRAIGFLLAGSVFPLVAFKAAEDVVIVATLAETLLERMILHENRVKTDKRPSNRLA